MRTGVPAARIRPRRTRAEDVSRWRAGNDAGYRPAAGTRNRPPRSELARGDAAAAPAGAPPARQLKLRYRAAAGPTNAPRHSRSAFVPRRALPEAPQT